MTTNNKRLIQLIEQDKDHKLILNKDAIEVIRNLDGPIAVCVCVGQYRSGKSFLLGQLGSVFLDEDPDLFKVDHGQDGFTKGLWMNSNIKKSNVNSNDSNIIFIDTEGIESNGIEEWDTRLFLFSFLASSLFMYNTNTTLSADTFKKLSVITNIADKISSKTDDYMGPNFLSIVRNFTLKSTYTPKEDIDRFLKSEKAKNEHSKKRNLIRQQMKDSFKSTECCRLAPPAFSVKMLQDMENYKLNELSDEFQNDFIDLTDKIDSLLEPKSIEGNLVNGFTFTEYLKMIVELINEDKLINLYDTMASVYNIEDEFYERKFTQLLKSFKDEIKSVDSIERDDALTFQKKIFDKDFKVSRNFNSFLKRLACEGITIELNRLLERLPLAKATLQDDYDEILNSYKVFNVKLDIETNLQLSQIMEKNEELINVIVVENFEKEFNNYDNIDVFNKDFAAFKSKSPYTLDWNIFKANQKVKGIINHINSLERQRKEEKARQEALDKEREDRERRDREYRERIEREDRERRERREREDRDRQERDNRERREREDRERREREERSRFNNNSYYSPPQTPSYASSYEPRATYVSRGSANGSEVFTGSRGGSYYVNSSGNKQYVNKGSVRYD